MAINKDVEIQRWDSLSQLCNWRTLLLGNGFSVNIWPKFDYKNLLVTANLSTTVQGLFSRLETTDFESVLSELQRAVAVDQSFDINPELLSKAYKEIKEKLFDAIENTHVQYHMIPPELFEDLQKEIWSFDHVFVTNYDRLVYWILMHNFNPPHPRSKDFMWNMPPTFNIYDVEPNPDQAALIYYPHGALHLWRDEMTGEEGKISRKVEYLLPDFRNEHFGETRRPLFVSEGSSASKTKAILNSRYLTFCLESLEKNAGNTVVFGHSMSDQDDHIVQALQAGESRRIAISVFLDHDRSKPQQKIHEIQGKLSSHDLFFFDSTTHPLGKREYEVST